MKSVDFQMNYTFFLNHHANVEQYCLYDGKDRRIAYLYFDYGMRRIESTNLPQNSMPTTLLKLQDRIVKSPFTSSAVLHGCCPFDDPVQMPLSTANSALRFG